MIIAIDGPAASGKSTVARATATRLGAGYLDTGAMYRAVAGEALHRGIGTDDADALADLARGLTIRFEREAGSVLPTRVIAEGRDVTREIRTPEVDAAVSPVSAVPGVREAMVRLQREAAVGGDWVVEGRDIGTVVFPEAPVKVFLSASDDERARRRRIDMERLGVDLTTESVRDKINARDTYDSSRPTSPLIAADDAVLLDTTTLSVEQVVDVVVALVEGAR